MEASNACPQCRGRLLAGAKNCLHCGALVAPGKSEAAGEGGSGVSMVTVGVIAVVGIVGAMILIFGAGASKTVDAVREPITFDGANVTSTVCTSSDEQIAELEAAGWKEIEAKDGARCFRD